MSEVDAIYTGTDGLLRIKVVDKLDNDAAITDATCTVTLYDRDNQPVTNATNLTMAHDAGGEYEVQWPNNLVINRNANYEARMTVVANGYTLSPIRRYRGADLYI
jgi:hypothetical protein